MWGELLFGIAAALAFRNYNIVGVKPYISMLYNHEVFRLSSSLKRRHESINNACATSLSVRYASLTLLESGVAIAPEASIRETVCHEVAAIDPVNLRGGLNPLTGIPFFG